MERTDTVDMLYLLLASSRLKIVIGKTRKGETRVERCSNVVLPSACLRMYIREAIASFWLR